MTRHDTADRIARLRSLADLLLDMRLSDLRTVAAARAESLERLADLDRAPPASDLPDLAAAEVAMRYQSWADQRRAEINLTLARQTATWIEARDDARLAFGKSQALQGLAGRLR